MFHSRNRSDNRRSKRFATLLPLFVFASVIVAVSFLLSSNFSAKKNARIFTEGVTISVDRSSPAFAAMEDTLLGNRIVANASSLEIEPTSVKMLNAGENTSEHLGEQLADKITRDNRREENLLIQARLSREATAKAMSQAASDALQQMAKTYADDQAQKQKASLPAIQHPTQTISLSSLKINREELLGQLLMPLATSGMKPAQARAAVAAAMSAPTRRPSTVSALFAHGNANDFAAPSKVADATVRENAVSLVNEPAQEPMSQIVVSGPIEFGGGLALTSGSDRIVVYREQDGEQIEAGAVWLREGRYEIFLNETDGVLVGELRNAGGLVVGRGNFELAELPKVRANQYRIDSIALKLLPIPEGIGGHVLALSPRDGKINGLAGATVSLWNLPLETRAQKDGRFSENSLLEDSSVLVRADQIGYWGTLAFANVGRDENITIHSMRSIEALLSVASRNRNADATASIVWGKVTQSGKTVSGARVELLTTPTEVAPIYFNSMMIPDPTLKTTSANGLYAFVGVSAGAHAVQASLGERLTDPTLFPTEERTVSMVDVELASEKKAKVRVFDAFRTDWPLAAELTNPGLTQSMTVDRTGQSVMRYPAGSSLMILDADGGQNYEKIRVSLTRDRRSIYVPMIQSQWLDRVRSSLKSNRETGSGTVVGFIQGSAPYQVSIEDKGKTDSTRLVYFDSRGEVTGENYGKPGGGFVMFNVREGFRVVSVQPSGTTKTFIANVLVDGKITNIVSQWLK